MLTWHILIGCFEGILFCEAVREERERAREKERERERDVAREKRGKKRERNITIYGLGNSYLSDISHGFGS